MPLYVDLHHIHSDYFSEEDAFKAHMKDLNVQDQFGVTHKKYWINFDQKTMFCLVDGPNKEACNAAHQMAHLDQACNIIIEVSDNEFISFLGIGKKNENDMALTLSNEIDSGYRTIMLVRICNLSTEQNYTGMVYGLVEQYDGKVVPQPNDRIMVSFIHASNAIACVTEIRKRLKPISDNLDLTMALVTGKPVDDHSAVLFEEAKKKVETLCQLGHDGAIYIDSESKALSRQEPNLPETKDNYIKIVNSRDYALFESLLQIFDDRLKHPDFKSEHLGQELGLSKAQTYRKIKALTEMSPNELIREVRLRRSLNALKNNNKTVAEIAYDLGFNSPTYFTRVFRKRFGVLPTSFAKLSNFHSL
ncbi:nickel-binding protein [Kriegella aquimaris]|uniref:AraC-type DNA-binding protein n=1 Tax=Kriegella aquimaris TaxID=192904 RepID=A0A1G9PNJ1_9FLAO|nr:nickel-binding protein [Kriegella aquimaris]SDM00408.1 AraC-type DNA-binding protein [Kriegella aquimaris]